PANAGAAVRFALEQCMERHYGTAYLTMSTRAAMADAPESPAAPPPSRLREDREDATGHAAAVLHTALKSAKRPLVMVGLGFDPIHAPGLRVWLERWGLPVAVTPKAKGIVDETAPNFVGVIGGMAADDPMCQGLKASDLRIGPRPDSGGGDKARPPEPAIMWRLEA